MPFIELNVGNFNIVCTVLGGFITVFGLVSYLLKEHFYLSEALISTIAGVIFSPHATNLIRPLDYALNNEVNLELITLYFSRLVLGVQLVLAGVQLPSKYLWKERKSLMILLGPGMCTMWIVTSLLVYALVPNIPFVYAISIGACVTPTDPVLSNGIVKGKFADKNIPVPLQRIIIAESGANDGLGYPFLFLGLYILKFIESGGAGAEGGAGRAMALWFGYTWAYEIILSIVYGAVVGWIAKDLLHWAEERKYVDRESFLVFAITLALFIIGTVGMIGSDDVLACFIAGNAFTWDDWFRQETEDDSLQPTIDMLLNVSIFIWFGAVCPWHKFVANDVIPIYRLIPLGILVLLLRRLPFVLAAHRNIHQIIDVRRAVFVGFFGPIGVSAVFYLYVAREFLRNVTVDSIVRPDAEHLSEVLDVVVWFLIICSIVVHGLSIPVGKVGFYLPRTLSTALSSERVFRSRSASRGRTGPESRDRSLANSVRHIQPTTERDPGAPADPDATSPSGHTHKSGNVLSRFWRVWAAGDVKAGDGSGSDNLGDRGADADRPKISAPRDGRAIGRPVVPLPTEEPQTPSALGRAVSPPGTPGLDMPTGFSSNADLADPVLMQRSIKFSDDRHPAAG